MTIDPDAMASQIFFNPNLLVTPDVKFPSPLGFGAYLRIAGGVSQATSDYIAGQQSSQLLKANAQLAREQATSELQAGSDQAELYRQHLNNTMGRQIAAVGGSGLTMSGSPLRNLESTSYLGAQDIQRIQVNSARRAWGYQTSAAGDEVRASLASREGTLNAIGGLITTGARAYGDWNSPS